MPCMYCEGLTGDECICGHAYCQECRKRLGSALCPMCLRLAGIQQEQAMMRRLVPWQVEDMRLVLPAREQYEPNYMTVPLLRLPSR